jgi:putative transposase
VIRYYYIQANRDKYLIAKMVRWAKVSRSGFYAWLRRKPSLRDKTNADLLQQIQKIYEENHRTYGSTRITRKLRDNGYLVNHKCVERIMRENLLRTKARRKFKATTYSDHDLPVNENLFDRDFTAEHPGEKMCSGIVKL